MRKSMIHVVTSGIFLTIFFLILYLVLTKKIDFIDQFFYEKIARFINPTNTKIMKFFTFFGSVVGIILIVLTSFIFLKDNFDRGFISLGVLGEVALNNLIKVLVKRARPTINPLVVETSHSFPSGHTMASTVIFLLITFFIWQSPLPRIAKIILTIPCLLIIILVLISRVYLGVHYFSDVIAGLVCSISYVLILTYFYTDLRKYFYI